jgi:hypothetical protein
MGYVLNCNYVNLYIELNISELCIYMILIIVL